MIRKIKTIPVGNIARITQSVRLDAADPVASLPALTALHHCREIIDFSPVPGVAVEDRRLLAEIMDVRMPPQPMTPIPIRTSCAI
jgi:hypothetical protein